MSAQNQLLSVILSNKTIKTNFFKVSFVYLKFSKAGVEKSDSQTASQHL